MKNSEVKPGYKQTVLGWIPEDWDVRSLGDIYDAINTPSFSRDNLTYEKTSNEILYIHYGDIHATFKTELLDLSKENRVPYLKDEFCSEKLNYLRDGDLVVADASEDYEGIGACIELINVTNKKVIGGLHTVVLRATKGSTATGFNTYIFRNYEVKLSLMKIATGISVYGISKSNLLKLLVPLPPLFEQKAIAKVLSTWDRAIEKIQELIAQKELRKKNLMQKLLSGKKRLPGFRSEWKSFQLGELVKISKGEQLNVMDMIHDGLFYVQNGGIEPSGFTDTWNCDVNTITISEGGNSCGFVKFHKEKFWYGGHCYAILNLRENLNLGFLFQLLKFKEPELMKLRVGSGLPNIQKKDIEHFILSIPSKSEQIGISNLLNLIDNEIEILKKKFDSIHQQKKGLMQVLLTGKKRITIN